MGFPELLRKLREKAGLSQSGLAKKTGLSVRSIQNWEQGHRGPSAQGIIALAQGLKVSAEVLLTGLRKGNRKREAREPGIGEEDSTKPPSLIVQVQNAISCSIPVEAATLDRSWRYGQRLGTSGAINWSMLALELVIWTIVALPLYLLIGWPDFWSSR